MHGKWEVVILLLHASKKLKLVFTKKQNKQTNKKTKHKPHKKKSQELNTSSTTLFPHLLPYPSEMYVEI